MLMRVRWKSKGAAGIQEEENAVIPCYALITRRQAARGYSPSFLNSAFSMAFCGEENGLTTVTPAQVKPS